MKVLERPSPAEAGLLAAGSVLVVGLALSRWWEPTAVVVAPLVLAAFAVAAFSCFSTARRGHVPAAWASLGLALVCWPAASVLWDMLSGAPSGVGLTAPVLYLAGFALAVNGIVRLPTAPWAPGEVLRTGLDAGVLFLSSIVVTQVLVLRPFLERVPIEEARALVLYTANDVLMATGAFVLARRQGRGVRSSGALLACSFALGTAGDLVLALPGVGPFASPTAVTGTLYLAGAVLLTTSAVVGRAPDRRSAAPPRRLLRSVTALVPEVIIVLACGVVVVEGMTTWYEWVTLALAAVVVVVRQTLTTVTARQVSESLRATVGRRTAELQRMAEDRATILDTVGEGILVVDADGCISFANATARQLLGAGPAALLGSVACESVCVHDDTRTCAVGAVRARGVTIHGGIASYRRADGTALCVEITATPKRAHPGGGRRGVVVVFRDVGDEALGEASKRRFVSHVSHELRTPLTSVRGALEVLLDGEAGPMTPEAQQLVLNAERGVVRLGRLVDDIIDAERLAQTAFTVAPSRQDLRSVLAEAVTAMRPAATRSAVLLDLESATAAVLVRCDPDRVHQALVNLIGNAVKFSPPGSDVLVGLDEGPREVVVSVSDHGRGIPADQLVRVFERFHQVERADASEKGGAGLGLAITRSIVEHHGGRIWVESTEGVGTSFHFTLPRDPAAAGTDVRAPAESETSDLVVRAGPDLVGR